MDSDEQIKTLQARVTLLEAALAAEIAERGHIPVLRPGDVTRINFETVSDSTNPLPFMGNWMPWQEIWPATAAG